MEEERCGEWEGEEGGGGGRKEGRSGSANNKMGKTPLTQARRRVDVGRVEGEEYTAVGETCF